MTTIYCPMKKCQYNNARLETDEGSCYKKEIELDIHECDYHDLPYCPEYNVIKNGQNKKEVIIK